MVALNQTSPLSITCNVTVSTEPMYTIYSLQRSDADIYTCIARNELGSQSSANVYLHVNDYWGKVIDVIEHSRVSDVPMTAKDYYNFKRAVSCRQSAKHSICTINIMFDIIPVNILYCCKWCHLIAYTLRSIKRVAKHALYNISSYIIIKD